MAPRGGRRSPSGSRASRCAKCCPSSNRKTFFRRKISIKITATLPRRWAALVAATGVIGFMLGGCSSSSTSGTTTPTYTVGGTVTGLISGTQLTLLDNGGNALAVSAVGSFQFSAAIASGSQYAVTVSTQPVAQTCSVNSGSGTMAQTLRTLPSPALRPPIRSAGASRRCLVGAA